MARRRGIIGAALLLAAVTAACTGPQRPRSPADIRPIWEVRNSPVPVPRPVMRPAPPRGSSPAPVTVASTRAVAPVARSAPDQVQPSRQVTVQRGDTVYAISRRHGTDVRALIAANNLKPPYLLRPGDKLRLPGARVHVVARGETSYGISRQYGVDLATLARENGLKPPYVLHVGQRLTLPAQAAAPRATASAPTPAAVRTALPSPSRRQGFTWPLQGRLLSSFGPKAGGLHNDGINLAAARGTPVKAADTGVVAYAGSDLRAFGNLVLVQHQGGWVTAYAHLDRIAVRRGQAIGRGDLIGHVGQTGGVTSPQLHFEIRQGRRAVNPLQHLPR